MPMLAPGSQSASIRLVSGADLSAASTRVLTAQSALLESGNLTLSNYHDSTASGYEAASVLRTGSGDLDLLVGGDFTQSSFYNVSTNGSADSPADLSVVVQGDLTGKIRWSGNTFPAKVSSNVSNWLSGNQGTDAYYDGFTGFGALEGGRVTITVGGDAGELTTPTFVSSTNTRDSTGLVVAATSGDVTVNIGGRLNPSGGTADSPTINGVFTALRGDLTIKSGAIGTLPLVYGVNEINDPRGVTYSTAAIVGSGGSSTGPLGAIAVIDGDGATALLTRGDLALGQVGTKATAALWTPQTSVSLFSAGGNLTPITYSTVKGTAYLEKDSASGYDIAVMLPPIFSAVAASGSIYYSGTNYTGGQPGEIAFRLMASPAGSLELLAMGSVYGAAALYNGARDQPARWEMLSDATLTLHDGDTDPIRVYAVNGDLVNVVLGETTTISQYGSVVSVDYLAAKAARVIAGGDIVNFGRAGTFYDHYNSWELYFPVVPSLILNTNANDVSVIKAGGDIFYANIEVAGPGTLEVSAGGNIYQGDTGTIASLGAIASGDTRSGASILITAGAGASGPDYSALAALYLDAANQANPALALAGQPGKVAKTYDNELIVWLKERFGYEAANAAAAVAYFNALPVEQRAIFLNQVYFAELTAGGREYNDPDSLRYGSYLRGRQMISTLFPAGQSYAGDITMFGGSGVRTLAGGDIQMLTPGGRQVIGVEGVVPPASAGLVTQGKGNIQLYSEGSILLGLSRIMTTFGGDILAWSATGDINAGRGSKTTLVYTPPRRVYDDVGNVTISPDVPSTGAGIATLNPIPEVAAGDVDLIAPLGTIDAGEAGIRVSGNVNIAALHVVNADNIKVQGEATGIPTVAAVNVAALTNASSAASSAATAAQDVMQRERGVARQNLPSIFTVRVLGFGSESVDEGSRQGASTASPSRYDPSGVVQVIGAGSLTTAQMQPLTESERRGLAR